MTTDLKLLTTEIICAHIANNTVDAAELPALIATVFDTIAKLGAETVEAEPLLPVDAKVTARKSLADPDKIISMLDGKPYSSLTRHITRLGYTPASYREAFGLKADYPMIAPGYSERRREIAKTLGLGRKAKAAPAPVKPPKVRKPRKAASPKAEQVGSGGTE